LPEEDCGYLGSFKDETFQPSSKVILAQFTDRATALAAEIELHEFFQVHVNPHFANRAKQTSVGWSTQGTQISEETKTKMRVAHSKRKVEQPEVEAQRVRVQKKKAKRWRQENADKWKEICQLGGAASAELKKKQPEKASADARKGGKVTAERRRKDPELDLKLRAAVSKATRARFTPEYQQMLNQKAQEACSKPVIAVNGLGEEFSFPSIKDCAQSLRVCKAVISAKLKGLPTKKLLDWTITYAPKLPLN
jgi:general stress protein YciG